MTDIVEQATRRLYEAGAPYADSKYWAQKLAEAGLLADPARTVPTREQIAAVAYHYEIDESDNLMPRTRWEIADAILALMDGQPTVAEVKAQALEEAADLTDNPHEDYWLRERARQIRGGK